MFKNIFVQNIIYLYQIKIRYEFGRFGLDAVNKIDRIFKFGFKYLNLN